MYTVVSLVYTPRFRFLTGTLKLGLNHWGGAVTTVAKNLSVVTLCPVSAVSRCFFGIGCLKFEYLSLFRFHVCFPCELQFG